MTMPRGRAMRDVDQILDEVATQVGLDDYGHPSFRDGLDVLVANVGAARLTPIGEAVFDGMVRQSLANRLRVTAWHKTHPEITTTEPDVAIVIVGLSRSGTTALSHLLGADPANRSLRGWEAGDCVPPPTTATYWDDPRLHAAESAESLVTRLNPGFKAIHHDEPREPVECAVPLAHHFASLSITTMMNIEPYDDWLLDADLTHAYDWHRQVLQVLQSQCPGPWQLKSPLHAYAIGTVAAAYPNALFVQTHRDPACCVASTLSLVASLSGTFTEHNFRAQIARHWPEILATMLDRVVEFRAKHGDDRFLDLPYRLLVEDPMACVQSIYDRIGRELTAESEQAMRSHLAAAVQHRHGTHTYSLGEFGLDRRALDERVASYWARFDVPQESARPSPVAG